MTRPPAGPAQAPGRPQQQMPYPAAGAYGAAPPAAPRPPAAGPSPSPARARRARIGMLAAVALVLLLVGGGALGEWRSREDAAGTYAEVLESQQLVLNGSDGEVAATGGYAGGSALIDRFGGRWSKLELEATLRSETVGEFTVRYELEGVPASGSGTIDRVTISTSLSAQRALELFYVAMDPDVEMTPEFVDGRLRVTERFPSGNVWISEDRYSARDGDGLVEYVRREYNGEDKRDEFDEEWYQGDLCARRGLDSTLEQWEIVDDERMVLRWRIDDLDVADLTHAVCLG